MPSILSFLVSHIHLVSYIHSLCKNLSLQDRIVCSALLLGIPVAIFTFSIFIELYSYVSPNNSLRQFSFSFAYEDLSMAVNEYYMEEQSDRLVFVQKLSNYFESQFQVIKSNIHDEIEL